MEGAEASTPSPWGLLSGAGLDERLQQLGDIIPDLADWPGRLVTSTPLPFYLSLHNGQLTLFATDEPRWAGIAVDFLAGAMAHRSRQPVGGELVVKAVWGRWKGALSVLDATAGLGRDGYLLAASGAQVVSCERHPAVALLLADGLWRARQAEAENPALNAILDRWSFRHASSVALMAELAPDVIYLDPMFPEREKSALVKKEMRAFRSLVGEDVDAQQLFDAACQFARKRVVVKRPSSGVTLGRTPSHVVEGKAARFDVYVVE